MRRLSWAYVGPACGVLFVVLSLSGLVIHGYPSGNGTQIRQWIATTNPTRFAVGIWIEAVGYLLLLPFAGWSVRYVRRPGKGDWEGDVAFGAAVLCTGSALLVNGIWTGLFDAGRANVDGNVLVGILNVASDTFQASNLFYGLFILAIGVVAVMARSLPPYLGVVGGHHRHPRSDPADITSRVAGSLDLDPCRVRASNHGRANVGSWRG